MLWPVNTEQEVMLVRAKDHLTLGRFLLNQYDHAGLQKYRFAFLLGCIEPDYNVATYTRGIWNHKKFRGHNAENSFTHIVKCMTDLQNDGLSSAWDYFTLGTMLHYVADAFTWPHNEFWKGNLLQHVIYERKLHEVFFHALRADIKNMPAPVGYSLIQYFGDVHDTYSAASHKLETDCRYIVGVCEAMLSGSLRYASVPTYGEYTMKEALL